MIEYFLLLSFAISMLALAMAYPGIKINLFLTQILIGVLCFFSGFRDNVGIDYKSQVEQFKQAESDTDTSLELAYLVVLPIINEVGLNVEILFFFMATLTSVFFYFFVIRHSRNPLLSVFFFLALPILYLSSMNISRQFVSSAVLAFSFRFITSRELYKWCFGVVFSCFFHKSAVLLFPLYFVLTLAPSITLYSIITTAYLIILQFIEKILPVTAISMSYLLRTDYIEGTSDKVVFLFILPCLISYFGRRSFRTEIERNLFLNLAFLMALISIAPEFVAIPTEIAWRMLPYFFIALPIQIVNIGYALQGHLRLAYVMVSIASLVVYYSYTIVVNGDIYNLVPFSSRIFG